MQTLHDENDGAVDLVVEAAEQRVAVPLLALEAAGFGLRVSGLHRVVDNEDVAAAAGQRAACRGREPEPSFHRHELGLG